MSEIEKSSVCQPIIIRSSQKSSKSTDTIVLEDSDNENDEPVEIIEEVDICNFIDENDLLNTSIEPAFFQDSQELKRKSIETVDLATEESPSPKVIKLDSNSEDWEDRSSHFYNITQHPSLPLGICDKRLKPFNSVFEEEVSRIALENSKRTRSVARKLESMTSKPKSSPVKKASPKKNSSDTKKAQKTKVQKNPKSTDQPSEFEKEIQKLLKQKDKSIRGASRKVKMPTRFESLYYFWLE